MISELEITIRLFIACALGGLIGLERQSMERPAGCTHILVCVGSALIMIISMYAFVGISYDPVVLPRRLSVELAFWVLEPLFARGFQ